MNRRSFIKYTGAISAASWLPMASVQALSGADNTQKLTILHTNDFHSRIDPFPDDGGRYAGRGGVLKKAQLISQIRKQEEHVILVDSGDIFQGTPYFNYFLGDPEIESMNQMQYDASTVGNHDFDAGIEKLAEHITQKATFPFIVSNYNMKDSLLHNTTSPYQIIQRGDIKIGLVSACIELNGLVPSKLCPGVSYLDPIGLVSDLAGFLKTEKGCQLVVCLSHLGYTYSDKSIMSDEILAAKTSNIDIILGGHTHTLIQDPAVRQNAEGAEVLISQVGWAGLYLGRIDLVFQKSRKLKGYRSAFKNI